MTNANKRAASAPKDSAQQIPTASAALGDGSLLEMVYDRAAATTSFVRWHNGEWKCVPHHVLHDGRALVPFSPRNNLLTHDVVLFPSEPEEFASKAELVAGIRSFLHRYVDLTPLFEQIAAHYILLSWVYDDFQELPYLRVMGAPGSGKTRFLLTVGSLCYKPIFASGASTVSPLFRILDSMKGTLVIDEADFRGSDEKSDVTKILNNGTVRGFPVLRAEQNAQTGEYNPHAYHVFGPKLVATRSGFEDRGLESRFISERLGMTHLRHDVPISLDGAHRSEALRLRNQLLLFRLRNHGAVSVPSDLDRSLEPRLLQGFGPLLALIDEEELRAGVLAMAREYQGQLVSDRGLDVDGRILEVIRDLSADGDVAPSIREIAANFALRFGDEAQGRVTPHWIGSQIRQRLGLSTQRRSGGYVIAPAETARLRELYRRYGLTEAAPGESSSSSQSSSDRTSTGPAP